MADTTENCPRSVAVPISVSVNTSSSIPSATKLHSASATNSGFTKISETVGASSTTIDFREGNKAEIRLLVYNNTTLNLKFPSYSGNFTLVLEQYLTGSIAIATWKALDADGNDDLNTPSGEFIPYTVTCSADQTGHATTSGGAYIWTSAPSKAEYEVELWGANITPTIKQIKSINLSKVKRN